MSFVFWLVAAASVICAKNLPLSWHFRFFWALSRRLPPSQKSIGCPSMPSRLFRPSVMSSRSPPTECDFNMHKSNSSYFTDLDVSRAHLSGLLFSPMFMGTTTLGRCDLIPGGVACTFRAEIKPMQAYEVWTKVASWDDKWIYMITHFVEKPRSSRGDGRLEQRKVFASAVTRMVFKQGRKRIKPIEAFMACRLLCKESGDESGLDVSEKSHIESEAVSMREVEEKGMRHRDAVQLMEGWDAVHALFDPGVSVLARC